MAQFPCLPLWTDAWVADTHHLTRSARGTYLDLLVLMWRTPCCRVPNDNAWLAKHLHMTLGEVEAELRPIIVEFCQTDGNWLMQRRLRKELARSSSYKVRMTDLRKRRKNKGNSTNTERTTSQVASPSPSIEEEETSSREVSSSSEYVERAGSPRLLASALPTGALARSAPPPTPPPQAPQTSNGGAAPKQAAEPAPGLYHRPTDAEELAYRSPPAAKSDNVLEPIPERPPHEGIKRP
jgi:uncharacterized protein YdaU (DUF1376 family)